MNYSFIFDTEAAYTTAKASGGVVYAALQNDNTYLSRSAISFCKDTGKTYIDGVNIIVPRNKGEIGDCLIYNTTKATYSWLKGTNAWNASALGSCTYVPANLTAAGYVLVGYLIHKNGLDDLILSISDMPYSSYCETPTLIPGVTTIENIAKNNNTAAPYMVRAASGSMYRAELQYNTFVSDISWPLPRVYWEQAKTAAFTNTSGSGTFTNGSWTVTAGANGLGTASILCRIFGSPTTINPADFDWDFDKWYRKKILLRFPTTDGVMSDFKGKQNTLALVASALSTPAADNCNFHGLTNVPDFVSGKWWLPSTPELWYALKNYKTLIDKGCPITNSKYWTSTQYSNSAAWYVDFFGGNVGNATRNSGARVRAIAVFRP